MRTPTSAAISSSDTASTPRRAEALGGDGEDAVARARRDRRHGGLSSTGYGSARWPPRSRPVDASDADAAGRDRRADRRPAGAAASGTSSTSARRPTGIRAELDALRAAVDRHACASSSTPAVRSIGVDARRVGRPSSGGAWLFGPWIDGDDAAWDRWARPLVDAAARPAAADDHVPRAVGQRRQRAAAAPGRRARAGRRPRSTTPTCSTRPPPQRGPRPTGDGLRGVVPEDLGLIAPLHELEFPNSYFSAPAAHRAGRRPASRSCVVATTDDGRFAGYAAGRVQPDGIGYIDFVAVDPTARGAGAGRRLVTGLVQRLLPDAPNGEVHLTVQEHRAPARGAVRGARLPDRTSASSATARRDAGTSGFASVHDLTGVGRCRALRRARCGRRALEAGVSTSRDGIRLCVSADASRASLTPNAGRRSGRDRRRVADLRPERSVATTAPSSPGRDDRTRRPSAVRFRFQSLFTTWATAEVRGIEPAADDRRGHDPALYQLVETC